MRPTGIAAIVVLATCASPVEAAAPPLLDEVGVLERLVTVGRRHDLLLPPRSARLVWYQPTRERDADLAFLVEENRPARRWLLREGRVINPIPDEAVIEPARPVPEEIKDREDQGWYSWLPAAQCYALGHRDLACALLRRYRSHNPVPTSHDVRSEAYSHALGEFGSGADRRLTLRRLGGLRAADKTLDTDRMKALIDGLRASLAPRKGPKGDIEKLVEDLLDNARRSTDGGRTPLEQLALMNFKAVPTLIGYLGDKRLTRCWIFEFFDGRPAAGYLTLGEMAWYFLVQIAGPSLGELPKLDRAKAVKWWESAQKTGEEANSAALVFPKGATRVNSHHLAVLRERYPNHLPELYRKVLAARGPRLRRGGWGQVDASEVIQAIRESKLPEKVKQDALGGGASTDSKPKPK